MIKNNNKSMDKIVIFDFCETLANFQTADAYIYYVIANKNKEWRDIFFGVIRVLFANKISRYVFFRLFHISINKFLLLKQIKGIKKDEMEKFAVDYYKKLVKPNLIQKTLDLLKKYKKEKYRVCVASAGYDIYLKFFVEDFKVDDLISTKLVFRNGIFMGEYESPDCIGNNKVILIQKYYSVDDFKNCDSISFSDSITDLPLLRLTRKSIVVSKHNSPSWAEREKFGVLIWE